MKEYLIGLCLGSAVTFIGAKLMGLFKKYEPIIIEKLEGADEAIEARFKIDIPDKYQAIYHQIIHDTVAWVEQYTNDAAFWRRVVRLIMTFDKSKCDSLFVEMSNIDWTAKIESQLSPELKDAVNAIKNEMANKIAAAQVETAIPAPIKPQAAIIARNIDVAASGVQISHKEDPVTLEKMNQLLEDSRIRIAKLRESALKKE